jgi:hypothetical protein
MGPSSFFTPGFLGKEPTMIRTWQASTSASTEGRLYDVEIPVHRVSVSSAVMGRPQGYEQVRIYVDNGWHRYLFYISSDDGDEAIEDNQDRYGYAYVEVYAIRANGRCPERPDFIYIVDTPHDYVELVAFLASLGGVRMRRDEEYDD